MCILYCNISLVFSQTEKTLNRSACKDAKIEELLLVVKLSTTSKMVSQSDVFVTPLTPNTDCCCVPRGQAMALLSHIKL